MLLMRPMKVNGVMGYLMGRALTITKMALFTLVNGKITKEKVKERELLRMAIITMVIGKMAIFMD